MASSIVPPSPSAQVSGTKRLVSPVTPSVKPKRQKIATAKAAALANDLGVNADGSAAKKRKQRNNVPEKGSKGGENINEPGMSPAIKGDCGSGEATSGTAVQPHLPPLSQVPTHFHKQTTEQGQQAGGDSPMSIKLPFPGSKTPETPTRPPTGLQLDCVASASQWQIHDDVIITSITQHTSASKLDNKEKRTQNHKRLMLKNDQWGRNQNTPITIDGSSDGEEDSSDARSPCDSHGRVDGKRLNISLFHPIHRHLLS